MGYDRRSGVALAMRHGLDLTYGLNSHRKGDKHPAYAPVKNGAFTILLG